VRLADRLYLIGQHLKPPLHAPAQGLWKLDNSRQKMMHVRSSSSPLTSPFLWCTMCFFDPKWQIKQRSTKGGRPLWPNRVEAPVPQCRHAMLLLGGQTLQPVPLAKNDRRLSLAPSSPVEMDDPTPTKIKSAVPRNSARTALAMSPFCSSACLPSQTWALSGMPLGMPWQRGAFGVVRMPFLFSLV
jgi:hypothetical protein